MYAPMSAPCLARYTAPQEYAEEVEDGERVEEEEEGNFWDEEDGYEGDAEGEGDGEVEADVAVVPTPEAKELEKFFEVMFDKIPDVLNKVRRCTMGRPLAAHKCWAPNSNP